MRDLANKMAELKFEAPLAQFEETDEWGPVDYQTANSNLSLKAALSDTLNLNLKEKNDNQSILLLEEALKDNCGGGGGGVGGGGGGNGGIDTMLMMHNKKGSPNCNSKANSMMILNGGVGMGGGVGQPTNLTTKTVTELINGDGITKTTTNTTQINNINSNANTDNMQQMLNMTSTPGNNSNGVNDYLCGLGIGGNNSTIDGNGTNGKQDNVDNFTETFSGSLEDLVNTFDEKITKCFGNYETSVEELAPVQVRSQEEIMNECQMWWTITGNFGNILPIDWSKSYARQMHMPALQLGQHNNGAGANGGVGGAGAGANGGGGINNSGLRKNGNIVGTPDDELNYLSSEDEAVANDLDMHTLILSGMHSENEPFKTAEEVIKEIDDIMDETTPSEADQHDVSEVMEKAKEVLGSPLYEDKLQTLKIPQLNELYMEMEVLIREFSETLISELALRDELDYEKELKNTFISLLLAVQNKRRQFHVQKKRGKTAQQSKPQSGLDPKYLTTVIPYHMESGPPDNQALQVLIKILKAINDDSPTVPTLLTDYILKVLCPT